MGLFRGKNAKMLTMMVAIAALIVFSFIGLTKRKDQQASDSEPVVEETEVTKVISKDLDKEYPASVREVVKFYCRVLSCLYNEETTDDQLLSLIDQERSLFDSELLKKNEYSEFVERQKSEITSFKGASNRIVNYEIQANEDVKTWYNNDIECASIVVITNISGQNLVKNQQTFYLRRDSDDKWKIVGFEETSSKDIKQSAKPTAK